MGGEAGSTTQIPLWGPELPRGAGQGTGHLRGWERWAWAGMQVRAGGTDGGTRQAREHRRLPRDGPGCGFWGTMISGVPQKMEA